MTKKIRTAEEKLDSLKRFLKKEIKKSEAILDDPFMQANLYDMDLGIHEEKIDYYTDILKKIESL